VFPLDELAYRGEQNGVSVDVAERTKLAGMDWIKILRYMLQDNMVVSLRKSSPSF